MSTRREFLQETAYGALMASIGPSTMVPGGPVSSSGAKDSEQPPTGADSDSDIGSLYPFVRSQAVTGEFALSFLRKEFTDLAAWKQTARGKLLDLLHYAPPRCDPRPETIERVDRGAYLQEKVYFNTTPDIRVPA